MTQHVVHQDPQSKQVWLTCDGYEYARVTVSSLNMDPQAWCNRMLDQHNEEEHKES